MNPGKRNTGSRHRMNYIHRKPEITRLFTYKYFGFMCSEITNCKLLAFVFRTFQTVQQRIFYSNPFESIQTLVARRSLQWPSLPPPHWHWHDVPRSLPRLGRSVVLSVLYRPVSSLCSYVCIDLRIFSFRPTSHPYGITEYRWITSEFHVLAISNIYSFNDVILFFTILLSVDYILVLPTDCHWYYFTAIVVTQLHYVFVVLW